MDAVESNSKLIVKNLYFEYPGKTALSDVSFEIEAQNITALVGPNGAGKSTLMRCLAGLDTPFSGEIWFNGIDVINEPKMAQAEIGYLADLFGVYENLTVKQCLWFAASIRGVEEQDLAPRIEKITALLELTQELDTLAGTLSRGMRQRLGIAEAIIHFPKLLILDEPASGLDPEARINLSRLLVDLKKTGMTIIVSSHILSELEDYSTEMIIIRDAKIIGKERLVNEPSKNDAHHIEIKFIPNGKSIKQQFPALTVITESNDSVVIEMMGQEEDKVTLLASLINANIQVSSFSVREKNMQDHYMSIAEKAAKREKKL